MNVKGQTELDSTTGSHELGRAGAGIEAEQAQQRIAELEAELKEAKKMVEQLMSDKNRVLHIDKYFDTHIKELGLFVDWLRKNPYPTETEQ